MKSDSDHPLNIAHRGASKLAPENTLAAFQKALEMGADGVELDVRLSADGAPVVIHDATVDATTDGTGRVDQKTLAELKELDAAAAFKRTRSGIMDSSPSRIPTLAEVLKVLGGRLLLNIELKGIRLFDDRLERAVVDQIKHRGLDEQVLLSSFNPLALRRIQEIAPGIPTGLLYSRPTWASLQLANLLISRPTTALHPHHAVVYQPLVQRVHARDQRVHVWTVDDPTIMRRLISWGVDGIITNTPGKLAEVLKAAS